MGNSWYPKITKCFLFFAIRKSLKAKSYEKNLFKSIHPDVFIIFAR